MEKYFTIMIIFCLFSYLQWSLQGLNIPEGFLGCIDDSQDNSVLEHVLNRSISNSGDECKHRCLAAGYAYAGTKFGVMCHCGNSCGKCRNATGCSIKCPGNTDEFCGGSNTLSLYDTRLLLENTSDANSFSTTTKAGEDGLPTAIYISVPALVIVLASIVVIIICWKYRRDSHLKYSTYYDDTVEQGQTSPTRVEYDYTDAINVATTDTENVRDSSAKAEPATKVKITHSYNHVTQPPIQYHDKSYSRLKKFKSAHSVNKVNGPYMISKRSMHLRTTNADAESIYYNEVNTKEKLRVEGNVFYLQSSEDNVDLDYDHVHLRKHDEEGKGTYSFQY